LALSDSCRIYVLGCGLPTEFADLKRGDIVVDIGAGVGNDVFVAR